MLAPLAFFCLLCASVVALCTHIVCRAAPRTKNSPHDGGRGCGAPSQGHLVPGHNRWQPSPDGEPMPERPYAPSARSSWAEQWKCSALPLPLGQMCCTCRCCVRARALRPSPVRPINGSCGRLRPMTAAAQPPTHSCRQAWGTTACLPPHQRMAPPPPPPRPSPAYDIGTATARHHGHECGR